MNAVGKIGLILGALGALVPVVVTFATGEVGTGLFVLSMVAGSFALVWFVFLRGMVRNARILKTGEPGTALIMEVHDTNVTINNQPVVKLVLEVTPQRGSKFTATAKVQVSRINPGAYQPGMQVDVKFDPNDQRYVAIVKSSASGTMASGVSQSNNTASSEAMEKLLRESELVRASVLESGNDAEGVILNSWDLGVQVNGIAVAKEFLVEVKIPGRPAFTTEIKGIVSHASLPKYRNGARVKIKYDPADPEKRITINGVV